MDVHYDVDDPVAVITLDRPAALNAFTWKTLQTLHDCVDAAVADRDVVGIIITGTGRGFCVGLDAAEMKATTSGKEAPSEVLDTGRLRGMFSYLIEQPKPIIAAINGTTAGGGLLLATMCDLRFASADATFVSVFARRGLTAELGVSWTLPHLIGTGKALDVLWSSRKISADEALQLGIVERVTEPGELLDTARAYVADLAQNVSPAALADIKQLVYGGLGQEIAPALVQACDATNAAIHQPDALEGAAAFVERRPPRFARLGKP
jgi:enoyl-CoA hydratase/carnithine racemase